jgi:hypothetical protein
MIIHKCARCGRTGARVLSNGKFFCSECAELFGTCGMCAHSLKCDFSTNPAPIPQFVMQHIRQQTPNGYMEQIKEAPNPERIKLCCLEPKCVCCDHDEERPHCMRQFRTCANYLEHEF